MIAGPADLSGPISGDAGSMKCTREIKTFDLNVSSMDL